MEPSWTNGLSVRSRGALQGTRRRGPRVSSGALRPRRRGRGRGRVSRHVLGRRGSYWWWLGGGGWGRNPPPWRAEPWRVGEGWLVCTRIFHFTNSIQVQTITYPPGHGPGSAKQAEGPASEGGGNFAQTVSGGGGEGGGYVRPAV